MNLFIFFFDLKTQKRKTFSFYAKLLRELKNKSINREKLCVATVKAAFEITFWFLRFGNKVKVS